MIKQTKLSNKCQITIPKQVRDFLQIDKGDDVIFYIENNEIKLSSAQNVDVKLKNDVKKATITKGEE